MKGDMEITQHDNGFSLHWSNPKEVTRKKYNKQGDPLPDETYESYDRHVEVFNDSTALCARLKQLLTKKLAK